MSALIIQRIPPSEQDALRTFAQDYWLELMPHASVIQDQERAAAYFASHFQLDAPDSTHWWAVVGERRIGFAKIDLAQDHDGGWAQVRDFYIDSAWRRQGWGRAFATALLAWLREQGVVRIDLNVRQDNPSALAFWQSIGFELALYRLRHYLD